MVASVTTIAAEVDWDTSMVILQLSNNSIYMVGGPGGEKKLPTKDKFVVNHIDGGLVVADKQAIKSLVNVLAPLTLLARYWVSPCCDDVLHHTNYNLPGYLHDDSHTQRQFQGHHLHKTSCKFSRPVPQPNGGGGTAEGGAFRRRSSGDGSSMGAKPFPPDSCHLPYDGRPDRKSPVKH
jgi:hypothetical protein